eukprot:TRINITY_DN4157_c0_g1_i4.p1 TRINITY_DN4157_c0_g1~~TRINITY_DN4157_c0_g1_i4.p1  ORF type:complete len:397 (-),score=32.94 TRINITY_DN4157_c0_g1_i4:80-1270(-)
MQRHPTSNQVTLKHLVDAGFLKVGGMLTSPSETTDYEEAEITKRGTILCLNSNIEYETPTAWVKSLFPTGKGSRSGWFYARYKDARLSTLKADFLAEAENESKKWKEQAALEKAAKEGNTIPDEKKEETNETENIDASSVRKGADTNPSRPSQTQSHIHVPIAIQMQNLRPQPHPLHTPHNNHRLQPPQHQQQQHQQQQHRPHQTHQTHPTQPYIQYLPYQPYQSESQPLHHHTHPHTPHHPHPPQHQPQHQPQHLQHRPQSQPSLPLPQTLSHNGPHHSRSPSPTPSPSSVSGLDQHRARSPSPSSGRNHAQSPLVRVPKLCHLPNSKINTSPSSGGITKTRTNKTPSDQMLPSVGSLLEEVELARVQTPIQKSQKRELCFTPPVFRYSFPLIRS